MNVKAHSTTKIIFTPYELEVILLHHTNSPENTFLDFDVATNEQFDEEDGEFAVYGLTLTHNVIKVNNGIKETTTTKKQLSVEKVEDILRTAWSQPDAVLSFDIEEKDDPLGGVYQQVKEIALTYKSANKLYFDYKAMPIVKEED